MVVFGCSHRAAATDGNGATTPYGGDNPQARGVRRPGTRMRSVSGFHRRWKHAAPPPPERKEAVCRQDHPQAQGVPPTLEAITTADLARNSVLLLGLKVSRTYANLKSAIATFLEIYAELCPCNQVTDVSPTAATIREQRVFRLPPPLPPVPHLHCPQIADDREDARSGSCLKKGERLLRRG